MNRPLRNHTTQYLEHWLLVETKGLEHPECRPSSERIIADIRRELEFRDNRDNEPPQRLSTTGDNK